MKGSHRVAARSRIAIIYDFDGTLAPGNIQERQFLPDIRVEPNEFWAETARRARIEGADEVLMYMRLMLEKASAADVPVQRRDFRKHGRKVTFFRGVRHWFDRITKYGALQRMEVKHFLISAGNEEMIEGTAIARHFDKIYASRFWFDRHRVAKWPARVVNYTTKTQYLFRINKDTHDSGDQSVINKFIAPDERPVPFANMIFIGDGPTDIPCFSLVKSLGGLSVAVFEPSDSEAFQRAGGFLKENRVDCAIPADYTRGSKLDKVVKARIDAIASRLRLERLIRAVNST